MENLSQEYPTGKIFRELRKEKNLKINHIACNICTPRTISNFEKGNHSLNMETFLNLLKAIDVTLEEFAICLQNYDLDADRKRAFSFELVTQYYDNNISMLQKYVKKLNQQANGKNADSILTILNFIHTLDPSFQIPKETIEKAQDHFFLVEKWGYFEYFTFANTVHLLPIRLACTIMKELLVQEDFYCKEHERILFLLIGLANLSYSCVKQGYMKEARFFLEAISEQVEACHFYPLICLRFMKGFYQLVNGEEEGESLMKKIINVFEISGHEIEVKKFSMYYDEALLLKEKSALKKSI